LGDIKDLGYFSASHFEDEDLDQKTPKNKFSKR